MIEERILIKKIKKLLKRASETHWYKKISSLLKYKKVKDYIDPDLVSARLATYLFIAEQSPLEFRYSDKITIKVTCAAHELANSKALPCFCLSEDLMKALCLTELPPHWIDLKPFVNSGILFLPKVIRNPDDFWLEWVYFSYYPKGHIFPDISIGKTPIKALDRPLEHPVFRWITGFKDLSAYSSTIILKKDEMGLPVRGNCHLAPNLEASGNNAELVTEQQFSTQVDDLIFQLMLYVMEKPDAINVDRSEVGFASPTKKYKSNEKLSPLWIGKDYQIKRQNSLSLQNNGTSKRTHWRSGHWRKQPYKSRQNPEYKNIWIEPTLISG